LWGNWECHLDGFTISREKLKTETLDNFKGNKIVKGY
jgi:hypothetical protein